MSEPRFCFGDWCRTPQELAESETECAICRAGRQEAYLSKTPKQRKRLEAAAAAMRRKRNGMTPRRCGAVASSTGKRCFRTTYDATGCAYHRARKAA